MLKRSRPHAPAQVAAAKKHRLANVREVCGVTRVGSSIRQAARFSLTRCTTALIGLLSPDSRVPFSKRSLIEQKCRQRLTEARSESGARGNRDCDVLGDLRRAL